MSIEGPLSFDERGNFLDSKGRIVQLRGINLDAGSKFPKTPYLPSYIPLKDQNSIFFNGDEVSFFGRPFPLLEVSKHILRLKNLGYNIIRFIITWEAIEHKGPNIYDDDYIDYTIEVLKIIDEIGGIFVYIDPHQDVWSRFSGGDGAPMWTLYAAGLNPKTFQNTQAAILQSHYYETPDEYPKMIWTTNYLRLAAGTMFVLFFAGKTFAPKAIINGENIQDYLQSHYINAITYFISKIKDKAHDIFHRTLLGIESLNEPNPGFISYPNISKIPDDQTLRLGTCPTLFQSLKLGMGIPTEVDEYKISIFGPSKTGSKLVDPQNQLAWIETDEYDLHYGFKRDENWKLGECIWAQHGVWDIETTTVLKDDYFAINPITDESIDEEYFINKFFVDHYQLFKNSIKKIEPDLIIFLQSPPLQLPPNLKERNSQLIDNKTVFCPHYYDGMSLLFKVWNRYYNVDTLGIMRKKYSNPAFGLILGEGNIRKSFKSQLKEMKDESSRLLGENIPVIFSEIGMPFDMDNKKAYQDGDFSSQTSALDALAYALEGSNLSHTWWCYSNDNSHEHGDGFNDEDFSFWSKDNIDDDGHNFGNYHDNDDDNDDDKNNNNNNDDNNDNNESDETIKKFNSLTLSKKDYHEYTASLSNSENNVDSFSTLSSNSRIKNKEPFINLKKTINNTSTLYDGLRAKDAIIRPYSIAINGEFIDSEFDLNKIQYTLKINGFKSPNKSTRIFLPEWHFESDHVFVEITSGYYKLDENEDILEWFHNDGEQTLIIKNLENNSLGSDSTDQSIVSQFLSCYT
ncbi:hypothetical protein WICMUC_001696 [Wickerhamomyces mucosus]|uniref:Glycoside hydrolase family 5 C-terminal domain-containing protein n=1 Tax=Wickerhamomyces mucosus TaxID=1378264 RepID=A0A9P8PV30_9ASCO|nr:hypothetical protein WICMUC_001696 [Wickerhamomyces mucosus]